MHRCVRAMHTSHASELCRCTFRGCTHLVRWARTTTGSSAGRLPIQVEATAPRSTGMLASCFPSTGSTRDRPYRRACDVCQPWHTTPCKKNPEKSKTTLAAPENNVVLEGRLAWCERRPAYGSVRFHPLLGVARVGQHVLDDVRRRALRFVAERRREAAGELDVVDAEHRNHFLVVCVTCAYVPQYNTQRIACVGF